MKKYKILALAIFACVTLNGWAQSEDNVTGRVLDEKGKPVAGAIVPVALFLWFSRNSHSV